jgi:hypothetical protein
LARRARVPGFRYRVRLNRFAAPQFERGSWPQQRPDFQPSDWSLEGGGKRLVISRIPTDRPFVVLEIGAFLGGSVRQWLAHSPNVRVVAIDPWEDEKWWGSYAEKHGRFDLAEQLRRPDGPYQTFLSTNWEYRSRLIPVRGRSPDVLTDLRDAGWLPDLVYFDSGKAGGDIEIVHSLWPRAILTGDDWTWLSEGEYPIRTAVRSFARKHGLEVAVDRATWAVTDSLTFRDRATNMMSWLRDRVRSHYRRRLATSPTAK